MQSFVGSSTTEWRSWMNFRRTCIRVAASAHRPLPLSVGLAFAMMLATAAPSHASAGSSVVNLAEPCRIMYNDYPPQLKAFCAEFFKTAIRANVRYQKHYDASKRRLIRRVVANVARRYVPNTSMVARGNPVLLARSSALGIGLLRDFGTKALNAVKTVVGGAMRFVPQAKVVNCGLLAALAGALSVIRGSDLRGVVLEAGGACLGAFLPLKT